MRDRTTDTAPKEHAERAPEKEPAVPDHPTTIFDLHRSAGNAAVVAMLARAQIQPTLEVGAVNDPAEAEADRLADTVLRALASGAGAGVGVDPIGRVSSTARRVAASDAPGHGYGGGVVDEGVARQIEEARGGGRALDPATRSRMEAGFGADFGGVRIHEDGRADTLSRSLNAKAFTTGRDIFFANGVSSDTRVLAHELAHTVQQGAAPVRRFMAVKDFEALTYESWDSTKSTAQKEIIKMLEAYKALGPQTAPPKGKAATITVPPEQLDNAIKLVENMKRAAIAYITAKEEVTKGKKERRLQGFVSFQIDCGIELEKLNQQKAAAATVTQAAVTVDDKGVQKLEQHYSGSLSKSMERAAKVVNYLAPNDGDSGEFVLSVDVPVATGVSIGARFTFEASKDGNTEVYCELEFTVAGNAGFAKIQGALGGYFKASGKTAESAMKLVSYGLYRRCVESSIIPSAVSSYLWGGATDEKAKKKAEAWSLAVEKEELADDDESFVETGGTATVEASGEIGVAEIEGSIKGTTGKRTDKKSLEASKGGAGNANSIATGQMFAQAQSSTARTVSSIALSAAVSAVGFGGDLGITFNFESAGKNQPSKFVGYEIEVAAHGTVPATGLEAKIFSLINDFISNVKKVQKGQLQKAGTVSKVGTAAAQSYQIADTVVQGVQGVPAAEALKKATLGQLMKPSESGGTAIETSALVGLELAYSLSVEGTDKKASFDLLYLSSMSAGLPGILAVELTKKRRIIGGKNEGGGWAWAF